MIKRILIIGGANGIGLAIATEFAVRESTEKVYVVDKVALAEEYTHPNILCCLWCHQSRVEEFH